MTSESRVLPSAVPSIYEIEKTLKSVGLTKDDIIVMIQNRMRGTPAKRDIEETLKALREIERNIRRQGGN